MTELESIKGGKGIKSIKGKHKEKAFDTSDTFPTF